MMVVFLFPNFAEASEIPNKSVADMPIFQPVVNYHGSAPIEQRGIEFRKWLAPSVKIAVSGGSGSGTIVYYDNLKNIAYTF